MSEAEFFDVKNSLYIGNYQHCINEAQKLQVSDDAGRVERDVFQYRALICQRKYGAVQSQIKANAPAALQALRMLAKFLQNPSNQSPVIDDIEQLVSTSNLETCSYVVALAAATIQAHCDNHEAALKVLHPHQNIECRALMVHCYLAMFRGDAARKELKSMQESDDDHTLTHLAQAWCCLSQGGEKLQDAFYIYQELIEKNSPTAVLLAGQAACQVGLGRQAEAESCLSEAQERDNNSPDVLLNLAVLSALQALPEKSANYVAQLKDSHPRHQVVQLQSQREQEFDRVCLQFSPSVAT